MMEQDNLAKPWAPALKGRWIPATPVLIRWSSEQKAAEEGVVPNSWTFSFFCPHSLLGRKELVLLPDEHSCSVREQHPGFPLNMQNPLKAVLVD